MPAPAVELRHVGRHAAIVICTFVVTLAVGSQVGDRALSVFAYTRVVAGCLAVLAAGAMFLYWRLDGRAQSWFLAVGFLTIGAPALIATRSVEVQSLVGLSSIATALVFFACAWRSPEVDSILSVRLAGCASAAGFIVTAMGSQALRTNATLARFGAIVVAMSAAALAIGWWRTERDRAWVVVPLIGLSLCCVATARPTPLAGSATEVSCVLVVISGVTVVAIMRGLQAVTGRYRTIALDAERERDLVASMREELEARYADTLHEVRSIVLALEGGIRVFGPSAVAGPAGGSITDSVVSELERLRLLADPDHASVPADFTVAEALRHLSALSVASGWPVTWKLDPRLRVRGRPADVAQIMHSLLTNARKHAPDSAVEVSAFVAGRFVLVLVDDDGPGVKPANRERIFERGERPGDDEREGHGLGLHIARRVARTLGGELWVEQRHGGGARFVLALRSAPASAATAAVHGTAS